LVEEPGVEELAIFVALVGEVVVVDVCRLWAGKLCECLPDVRRGHNLNFPNCEGRVSDDSGSDDMSGDGCVIVSRHGGCEGSGDETVRNF
jgi:hypothetical protein